ncbi:hypothetical protein Mapa_015577 [Marchantia paleacea]|nr:hypothetical protein Mapa_015577 [Marchantia paleacea]
MNIKLGADLLFDGAQSGVVLERFPVHLLLSLPRRKRSSVTITLQSSDQDTFSTLQGFKKIRMLQLHSHK